LRAAEEALRQALERGASDEEIKRLTDQLRAALDKFMQALAEQLRKNPQQLARPLDPNARQIRPQQMARSGARDAARRMRDRERGSACAAARPALSCSRSETLGKTINGLDNPDPR
jgi:uncharacterized protein DUF4175